MPLQPSAKTKANQYRKQLGQLGEKIARQYLKKLGYQLMSKNFYLRGGELDLVMTFQNKIIFFEIKTRQPSQSHHNFGLADEQISWQQKHTLIRSARSFLHLHNLSASPWQFDLISINLKLFGDLPQAKITHIPDIFAQ